MSASPITFQRLGLSQPLLRAAQAAGFTRPTPVQASTIPLVLEGRDVLACAQTGSGKTAAFGLPLLQHACERPSPRGERGERGQRGQRGNYVSVLVVVPTRELAVQIAEVLQGFARALPTQVRVLGVHGGVSINPQMLSLRGGVDVLVATPGRLLDLERHNAVRLSQVTALVLDEADRLLGLGFADELAELVALLPKRRQTLLLSATFPEQLGTFARELLHEPVAIGFDTQQPERAHEPEPSALRLPSSAASAPLIEQHVYTVDAAKKSALLIHLITTRELEQVLVFVSMKKTADALIGKLARANIRAAVFHADRSQAERTRTLAEFRSGSLRVLLATDLAARGIDIEELPTVINFELPRSPNDYVHRIGRTGRAGRTGVALSLICPAEYQHFGVIEKRIKQKLLRERIAGFEPA